MQLKVNPCKKKIDKLKKKRETYYMITAVFFAERNTAVFGR